MIKMALFGAGRMGSIHAHNLALLPHVDLRYVVDPQTSSAQSLAQSLGATVAQADQIFEKGAVDGLVIAGVTASHVPLILRAAQAGLPVFCEKPLDLDLARIQEVIDVLEKHQTPFCLGFQRRFDATFSAVQEAVTSGRIGKVELLHITSRDPSPPPDDYVRQCGGIFVDMMIHDFDMASWLLQSPIVEVYASGSNLVAPIFGACGDWDTAVVLLKAASGAIATINNSRRAVYGYDQRLEIFGSEGLLQANNQRDHHMSHWGRQGLSSEKPSYFFLERYREAYAAEMRHFVEVIQGKAKARVGAQAGLQSLQLALAAARSASLGQPVKLTT